MPPLIATLFGGAWSLIQRVFKAAVSYPWQTALVIALAACGWLHMGKQSALATIAKRDETIAQMEAARKIATAAQMALFNEVTSKQTQIAKDADNAKTDIVERGNRAADRMRAKDYCIAAATTSENGIASGSDVTSDTAIVLDRRDYDILVGNTARLVQVKAWSDRLIAEGMAVPVE